MKLSEKYYEGLIAKAKNLPVEKFSLKQIEDLLRVLIYELSKGNTKYIKDMFEIIDRLSNNNNKSNIAENLFFDVKNSVSGQEWNLFYKEYCLKYKTKSELLEIIDSNDFELRIYKKDFVQKIFPSLNKSEINGLLISCRYDENITEYILKNYKGTLDIGVFNECIYNFLDINNTNNLLLFNKLSYEDKLKVLRNVDAFSKDKWIDSIKDLKEEDRLYLELSSGSKNTPVSKDTFIKYVNKYGENNISSYMDCLYDFENEDLNEILEKINVDSPLYSQVKSEILCREYSKINQIEKKEYLLNLPISVLNSDFYLFKNDIKLLNKEELLKKLNGHKITDSRFADYVFNNFNIGELKENNVKFFPVCAIESDFYETDLLDINMNDDEKKNFALALCFKLTRGKSKSDLWGEDSNDQVNKNEERERMYKKELKEILKSGIDVKFAFLNDVFEIEDITEILKHNKNMASNLNYRAFDEQELIKLKDYAFNNEKYLLQVLSTREYDGNMNDEYTKLQLEMLSNIKDNYIFNNLSILKDINVIKDLIKTQNKQSLLKAVPLFIKKGNQVDSIIENNLDKESLLYYDSSGKLLELYESINEENLKKVGYEHYKNSLIGDFFDNIERINENKETLLKLKESNPHIMITMNYKILDVLKGKSLEYFSRYKDLKRLNDFNESGKKLVNKIVNRVLESREYQEELIDKCLRYVSKLSEKSIEKLLEEEVDKIIYLINKDSIALKGDVSSFGYDEKEYCDNVIRTSENIEECLDAFFREKCKLDLDSARRLVRVYGSDIEGLKKAYPNNEKVIKSINMLENIKKLLKISDKEKIVDFYNSTKSVDNYSFPVVLEENLKLAYNKEIISSLYKAKEEECIAPNVYEVKGDFKMLVSVIGAFVENKDSVNNPSENWNDKEKLENHGICTSLIANNNLSFVYSPGKLVYGFNSLEDNSLLKVASYDLGTTSDSVQINSFYEEQYKTSSEIIDHVRSGHSELLLERREAVSNNKRQPDYIVAIDTIRDMDRKAAKEFNIPIVLIKSEKIAYQESVKLFDLYQKILENPSSDKIDMLIKAYHNNYSGLLSVNPKLNKKYFNPKKFEKMLKDIIERIYSISDENVRAHLLKSFIRSLTIEEEKCASVGKKIMPFPFDDLKDKIINNKISNISFFEKIKKNLSVKR